MKVSDALASAFVKEGVTTVFGLMGNGNMYWWHALDQHPDVAIYETRHEGTALTMAEGWARATGQPGICTVTQGPGLSQLATALIVAARAKVPMVVFAGDTALDDPDGVQQLDQARFAAATEAGFVPIWKASEAEDAVRTAFYRARVESRPIVLNAPIDVQAEDYDGDLDEYQPSSTLLPGRQRVQPDADLLREAARVIAESKKPVIVAGQGAAAAGAGEAITQLADRIGALLATTLPMKGWLGESEYHVGVSGLYATRTAIELFADADVVIGVGASLNHYTTEHGYIFPNARYVQIDLKPSIVMGTGKRADHYLQGDAKLTVEMLDRQLAEQGVSSTGFRTAETRAMLAEYDPDPREFELDPGTVDPRQVAAILDDASAVGGRRRTRHRPLLRHHRHLHAQAAQADLDRQHFRVHRPGGPNRNRRGRRAQRGAAGRGGRRRQHADAHVGAGNGRAAGRQATDRRVQRRGARSRVPEVRVQEDGGPGRGHPHARPRRRGAGVRLPRPAGAHVGRGQGRRGRVHGRRWADAARHPRLAQRHQRAVQPALVRRGRLRKAVGDQAILSRQQGILATDPICEGAASDGTVG